MNNNYAYIEVSVPRFDLRHLNLARLLFFRPNTFMSACAVCKFLTFFPRPDPLLPSLYFFFFVRRKYEKFSHLVSFFFVFFSSFFFLFFFPCFFLSFFSSLYGTVRKRVIVRTNSLYSRISVLFSQHFFSREFCVRLCNCCVYTCTHT